MDVSIIITSYNYDLYIKDCINSCLNQKNTKLKYEVIVVDDGSQDSTESILNGISSQILRKYKIFNSGIERASNYGFSLAIGKFVVRVDADDMLHTNYLSTMEKFIESDYSFFYSDYDVINEKNFLDKNVALPSFSAKEITSRGDFLATGTMYSSKVLKKLGGYCELEKNTGLENYELILRIIANGEQGFHVRSNLFMYRKHGNNLSSKKKDHIIKSGMKLFSRLGLGEYRTNEHHPYIEKILGI